MPDKSYLRKIINCEAIIKQPLLLPAFIEKELFVDVLRLDLIHPVISGNKYFKLKDAIANAIDDQVKGIISFGGAYSNHLVALSFLCQSLGIKFVGVIRGEQPKTLSSSLEDALNYGMIPLFVSRSRYADKNSLTAYLETQYPAFKIIPEGGQSAEGVGGASAITTLTDIAAYTTIACAVGTGTMMAGLLKGTTANQRVLGISALKLPVPNNVEAFILQHAAGRSFEILYNYHFGGYARKTTGLIHFMNELWQRHQLPTDFVYTAKLMFAMGDLAAKGHFTAGSRILIIHSGGLQGNRSIADSLYF